MNLFLTRWKISVSGYQLVIWEMFPIVYFCSHVFMITQVICLKFQTTSRKQKYWEGQRLTHIISRRLEHLKKPLELISLRSLSQKLQRSNSKPSIIQQPESSCSKPMILQRWLVNWMNLKQDIQLLMIESMRHTRLVTNCWITWKNRLFWIIISEVNKMNLKRSLARWLTRPKSSLVLSYTISWVAWRGNR